RGTLDRCVVVGNSSLMSGAGVNGATVFNSLIQSNSVTGGFTGGGAAGGFLFNCTIIGNSGPQAGGGVGNVLGVYNSIVYFNSPLNWQNSTVTNTCTTPLPSGPRNIVSDPQLTDSIHLALDSPCRAAGALSYSMGSDL